MSDQFLTNLILGQVVSGSGQFWFRSVFGRVIFERTILRKGQRAKKAKKIKRTKIRINQNHQNSSPKRNLRKIIFVQVGKF